MELVTYTFFWTRGLVSFVYISLVYVEGVSYVCIFLVNCDGVS